MSYGKQFHWQNSVCVKITTYIKLSSEVHLVDQSHASTRQVVSPTADPGVPSLIPAQSHTFLEVDHEIISTVILLLPLIQEGLL